MPKGYGYGVKYSEGSKVKQRKRKTTMAKSLGMKSKRKKSAKA